MFPDPLQKRSCRSLLPRPQLPLAVPVAQQPHFPTFTLQHPLSPPHLPNPPAPSLHPRTPTTMPASTRASTGNSKPRLLQQVENAITPKKRSPTTANTSKPRTATGRIAKPKAAASSTGPRTKVVKKRRTPTEKVKDAVVGAAEKVVGEVQGKPGKKAAGTRKVNGTGKGATRRRV